MGVGRAYRYRDCWVGGTGGGEWGHEKGFWCDQNVFGKVSRRVLDDFSTLVLAARGIGKTEGQPIALSKTREDNFAEFEASW